MELLENQNPESLADLKFSQLTHSHKRKIPPVWTLKEIYDEIRNGKLFDPVTPHPPRKKFSSDPLHSKLSLPRQFNPTGMIRYGKIAYSGLVGAKTPSSRRMGAFLSSGTISRDPHVVLSYYSREEKIHYTLVRVDSEYKDYFVATQQVWVYVSNLLGLLDSGEVVYDEQAPALMALPFCRDDWCLLKLWAVALEVRV